MQHFPAICFVLLTLYACSPNNKVEKAAPISTSTECKEGKDTINHITSFSKDTSNVPAERFFSVVDFIVAKGLFKPHLVKTGKLKIQKEDKKISPVAYDTCNMKRWVFKNFILKNVGVTKLYFRGIRKDKYTGFTPGLSLEEWKFMSNADRDSAMRVVQTAYNYLNNIVMYEKRYSQFILDDKRIFLLETGAKFSEYYAIEYKDLIQSFLYKNNNR